MGFFSDVLGVAAPVVGGIFGGPAGAAIGGALAGGLAGGSGSGDPAGYTTSTQNTTQSPWAPQQPYLERGFQRAEDLYQQGAPEYFQGEAVAGFDPATQQALQMQEQRALAGSPLLQGAQGGLQETIAGKYLGEQNPYLPQMINTAQDAAQRRLATQFSGAGRYGSGLHKIGLGKELMGIEAGVLGGAYEKERARQMQAIGMAQGLSEADYVDPSQLAEVGLAREQQEQRLIDADKAKWSYEANAPRQALADYMRSIQGQYGGQTTGTTADPYFQNKTAGMLGGALAGGQLGSMLFPGTSGAETLSAGGGASPYGLGTYVA